MTEYAKKNVAIVTYNRIGRGQYENGLLEAKDCNIYIAQNGHRAKWAVDQDSAPTRSERARIRSHAAKNALNQLDLQDMDHIYLYVGTHGAEDVIKETRDIPAEKISYVLCDCNYYRKKEMIESIGNKDAEVIDSECGGRETLERIVKKFAA